MRWKEVFRRDLGTAGRDYSRGGRESMSQVKDMFREHPCFHKAAAQWFGRLHLPVAPRCNIKCYYCSRMYDCANESRPGVTSRLLTPRDAVKWVDQVLQKDNTIRVVGVAGPGDPLANKETLETFRLVHQHYPRLIKCLSTNGLLLLDQLDELEEAGVKVITVTVNAVNSEIGSKIYGWVYYRNKVYHGQAGAELLLKNQLAGLQEAVRRGMMVKVNTVLIPGINETHLTEVAVQVKKMGVYMMNVMPLIPQAEFALLPVPSSQQLHAARRSLAPIVRQMQHCRQCRADAVGKL